MAALATIHTLVFGALVLFATATAERLDVRRRRAEADRQRLADVVETTTDLVAIAGPDARLLYLNRAGRRMAGIPEDEDVAGLPLAALLPPAAAELVARTVVPALVEGGSWRGESALLRRDGGEVPVSVVASGHRRGGSVAWMAAVMRDVSAEKRAQEDLAGERTMLEGLLLSAPVGLGFVDRSIRFVRINDALARYAGRSAADHLGRSVSEMVPHLWPLLEPIFRRVLDGGETLRDVPISDEAVARPGEAVHTSCSYYPVRDAGGGISGVGIVFADVTDRVRAEEALREADRRKDEFLATLAHELRNPLAPLRTGLEVLKRLPTSPREARIVGVMERQLAHMVRLVEDLLDVSRISRGRVDLRKTNVPLRAVLEDALETSRPLVDARRQELVTGLPEPSLVVEADRTRLAQVVSNLMNNAAKFTPEGGRIRLAAWREGGGAVIQVADDGVGIPPDLLPRVFDLFTQGGRSLDPAQGGLGIGLSLVQRLVELHGGTVRAESEGAGKGSTFTVRIPVAASPAAEERPGEEALRLPTSPRLRVLVVDDNVDAGATLAELVSLSGHAVRTAHEGTGALVSVREFHPDVVFLDIGLPDISGYEVARRVREEHGADRALLVALTGWGGEEDRRRSRDAGFDVHLTKPVAWDDVERVLDRAGHERRGSVDPSPGLPSPGSA
ncbi:PAS domain-containing protein [Myxococcota bacterium]|nr:PAS domain-containing protein [Myxococcota bacterium]